MSACPLCGRDDKPPHFCNEPVPQAEEQEEKPQTIVAEVSKSWPPEEGPSAAELLSQRFEIVINTNRERGYKLRDWNMTAIVSEDCITETIVAVFELDTTTIKIVKLD